MFCKVLTFFFLTITISKASINLDFISNPLSASLAIRVSGINHVGENNKFIKYKNGTYYQKNKNEIYYFENLSKEEMLDYINKFKQKTFYEFVLNGLINNAHADICDYSFTNTNLNNPESIQVKLQDSFNRVNFSSMIQKCDYSISNIFKKQYEKYAVNLPTSFDLRIFDNFSNIHKELQKFIQSFSSEIMPLLVEMSSEVPNFINHLFCGFTENKIGDMVIVGMTGGMGSALKAAETTSELLKIVSTLNAIKNNSKLIDMVVKLEKSGKLDKSTSNALLNLKHDVDTSAIDPVRNRFRNAENKSKHRDKHCVELKCVSEDEYEKMAQDFVRKKSDHDVVFQEKNGDILKWNTQTDEYLVMNKYGNFISYYKLKCKVEADKLLYLVLPKDAKKGMCNE